MKIDRIQRAVVERKTNKVAFSTRIAPKTVEQMAEIGLLLAEFNDTKKVLTPTIIEIAVDELLNTLKDK